MAQILRLIGVTDKDRHQVVAQAQAAINDCGGWIADFHLFSNLSICLNFELPVNNLEPFQAALFKAGIQLNAESTESLPKFPQQTDSEIKGSLQITFLHNEPDLRREVPAFG